MCEQTRASKPVGLSPKQRLVKRLFDISVALPGLIVSTPVIVVAVAISTLDTREWGIFGQERVGRNGTTCRIHKIRSMRSSQAFTTTVTASSDPRITRFGGILRRTKVDELIQLWDVLVGRMSLVGPRPDVPGWADCLVGDDRVVLSVRPGITGPASIEFRDEEKLLSEQADPETYNREVIWPQKVALNKEYVANWTLAGDVAYIIRTIR